MSKYMEKFCTWWAFVTTEWPCFKEKKNEIIKLKVFFEPKISFA